VDPVKSAANIENLLEEILRKVSQDGEYLTIDDVAARLKCGRKTILNRMSTGIYREGGSLLSARGDRQSRPAPTLRSSLQVERYCSVGRGRQEQRQHGLSSTQRKRKQLTLPNSYYSMGKMSCRVKVIGKPPADYLHFQIFWRGQRFWQRTGLKNTRQNLEMVEATARAISQQIKDGNFNYLQFFPGGTRLTCSGAIPTTTSRPGLH
jgi:Arm DNA-binding domain